MPRLKEPPPSDLPALRSLLKALYEANCDPRPGSHQPKLSKARVSIACGMQDPGWLNKVISGAPGCQNFRTDTLVRFANVLALTNTDRKRLARASGRPVTAFAPPVISSPLEAMSMRRAVLLMSTERPRDTAESIHAVMADLPKSSIRLSRVFGAHDMILRVTTPPGHLVLPEIVDRIRSSIRSIDTDTLLLRDDQAFLVQSRKVHGTSEVGPRRAAYVFLEGTGSFDHEEIVRSIIESASAFAANLLTAAVLVGRFDAVAEILVDRLNDLDSFIQGLRRLLPRSLKTVTYPTVQTIQEIANTPW